MGLIIKLLLENVGLPHVVDLAVYLVNFFGWMSQGGHSEPLLLSALFYESTPSCLKVMGGVGGPCDFSVSPSPFCLDFGTLDLDFGLGLDNIKYIQQVQQCPDSSSVGRPLS